MQVARPSRLDIDISPSILWIFCDELRADGLSCYGNEHAAVSTPSIDAIAEAGVRFDNFWVNSPVCVSSRAAFKSGMHPTRTAIYHNEALYLPGHGDPESFVTGFERAGYATANLGKEHVPEDLRGFAYSESDGAGQFEMMGAAGAMGDRLGVRANAIGLHGGTWPSGEPFPPDRLTDHAVDWLRAGRPEDAPWLLRVSYLQPHTPVVVPEPWASRYDDEPWPDEVGPNAGLSAYERAFAEVAGGAALSPEQLVLAQSRYHGLVSWIDDQVGRLISALSERGLLESTIVVFTSDHGAQLGELGGAFGKMVFSHWSQRVPFIVSWPGELAEGDERADLAQGVDLGPTLTGLAGIATRDGLDGRDLFADPEPEAVFAVIGYGNPGSQPLSMVGRGSGPDGTGWPQRSCVRTRRWRLDRNARRDGQPVGPSDRDTFLADMETDPREEQNLAEDTAMTEVVTALGSLLDGYEAGAAQVDPADYEGWRERFHAELASRFDESDAETIDKFGGAQS